MKSRENRKVNRIKLGQPLKVVICSIGAHVKYELTTSDVSNNGFFLSFENPGRFPFNQSSIMEIWLSLGEDRTIFFNGKVARVVQPVEGQDAPVKESGIAVRIVQIDKDSEDLLKGFISERIVETESQAAS